MSKILIIEKKSKEIDFQHWKAFHAPYMVLSGIIVYNISSDKTLSLYLILSLIYT